jgi:alkylation response protein AidB-like acyl-CoA dehydrogenase
MPIGIREEHEELRRAVRRWTERRSGPEVTRAAFDAEVEALPAFWAELAEQGWLGIHVPEELGGQGYGLVELAVVIEELGRALTPGPFLPSVLSAAVIARSNDGAQAKALVPGIADGSVRAAVAFGPFAPPLAREADDGSLVVTGHLPAVLGAGLAEHLVFPVTGPGGGSPTRWCVIDLGALGPTPGVTVTARACLDASRRSAAVDFRDVVVVPERVLFGVCDDVVSQIALVLAAAEVTGSARWCLEAATEHARTRIQFGRPIGQFQGVKHKLADLLCVLEQMTAATWDAAVAAAGGDPQQAALSAATAGGLALDGGVRAAKDAIQVLGGMGFTWEHDAHLHLRRAATLRQLLGGSGRWRESVAGLALGGVRRSLGIELPAEADDLRTELRPAVAQVAATPPDDQRRVLGERGLLFPHWPKPYGRDAGPVEQLVIDELLAKAGIRRPPAHVAAWALPTIITHGRPEQRERWVLPTLRGELLWCQLFSEPGAGSDLAALSTKASPVDGGWVLEGQKVWTSVAARANVGICLARTDPDAPKHEGITYFVLDMRTEGIEVRPLREITGDALFNEVFFNQVFVPDDCVVGPVNGGWRLARTTLANERVSLASDSAFGGALETVLAELASPEATDAARLATLGALLVEAQSLAIMGLRATLRSVSGLEPGPESSVRKLLGAEHDQRISDFGLELCGPEGVYADGASARGARSFLHSLCLTIAGGTSEVQRNVIGERLLGLPRDPEPAGGGR